MYVRLAGCLLILAAAAGLGLSAGRNYRRQAEELAYLCRLIWQIRGEISYTRAPLSQVFRRVGERSRGPYREWLWALSDRTRQGSGARFGELWRDCAGERLRGLSLPPGEWDELLELGGQMGYLDARMLEQALEWYGERAKERLSLLEASLAERQKLCGWLGVLGGLFVVILAL